MVVLIIMIKFFHFMNFLLAIVLIFENSLIEFLDQVVLEVEDLPAQGSEAGALFQEVCELGHVTAAHLIVTPHDELEDCVHFCLGATFLTVKVGGIITFI